jgi:hypothetical protein
MHRVAMRASATTAPGAAPRATLNASPSGFFVAISAVFQDIPPPVLQPDHRAHRAHRHDTAEGHMSGPTELADSLCPAVARPLTRRGCLRHAGLALAATALLQSPIALRDGWIREARASTGGVVEQTLSGLVAFIVPGADPYSVQQGVHTIESGGLEAAGVGPLISALDAAAPIPAFSAIVAGILNNVAHVVHEGIAGPFLSAFASLAFQEKAAVFSILEADEQAKGLAGVLPGLVAFLSYSEVGVFDPSTRTLIGRPVGWTLSGYEGMANGRDAFKGYFQQRRSVHS